MRTAFLSALLFLFSAGGLLAQTGNFDETWKEFLVNKSISNTSTLVKPDPRTDLDDYSKYVLMNLNNAFCQSKLDRAAHWKSELAQIDPESYKDIPGYAQRLEDIQSKMQMGDKVEALWQAFLKNRTVDQADLSANIKAANNCEKQTLAKFSYMQAYANLCQGEVALATTIFNNRTLQLAEKTSLRVADVPGLAPEVANMKKFFRALPRLKKTWADYVETGESPGWKEDLPVYNCYPEPNIKAFILRGAADACGEAPEALTEIEALIEASGAELSETLQEQVDALRSTVSDQRTGRADLDAAWEAFLPSNEVDPDLPYGYEYCRKLPLIRAHLMDGFAFVCETAEESLYQIKELQKSKPAKLDKATKDKIAELEILYQAYLDNGTRIDQLWDQFVAQGDTLYSEYESTDNYCDNIQRIKDWTMRGLAGNCDSPDFYQNLEKIDYFQESFTFTFYEELECRVQKLRRRVYDCRYGILRTLAEVDEESTDPLEDRLQALLDEHDMGERPVLCEEE